MAEGSGESQGWGTLVGCSQWGRTESDMTEATQQQQPQWNKTVDTLFNKVLGKSEKCVFYFYLKTEGTLYPTQQPEIGHDRIIYTTKVSKL